MEQLKQLPRETKRKIALGSGITGALMLGYAINDMYGISSDLGYIRKLLALKKAVEHHNANNNTYADIWEDAVKKWPRKVCLHFEGKDFTFEQVDKTANRIAHWAVGRGVKAGDVVALMMENRAEYVPIWLGLLKAGSIVALINCNLKGRPLHHSLTISKAKLLIVGTELLESVDEQRAQLLREGWSIITQGGSGSQGLDAEIANLSAATPSRKLRNGVKFSDPALLVYTSGTTGLPKAATLKHLRLFTMGAAFVSMFNVQHDDRIYCVLPLYHSAGGVCGVGMMVLAGGTLVLKRKFSATQFWADCKEQKVTVIQYIGELCRYLLAAPPSKHDQAHKVRIAIGNGLRPDIWESFQKRFNVPEIGEFYGSTEGNAALFNHCTDAASRGAVGRMGPLLYKASQMKLVKFDVQREEPVRDKNGMLIECKRGEVGELLGEIVDGDPVRGFAGYYGNAGATKNKIISDCFKKGDKYFRTGDLLKHDEKGYWHFIDRIGDTFRWKGENVSTTEVAEAVSVFPGVSEVNVYGVEVPKGDGRACMAAMIFDDKIDMKALAQHCLKNLPPYAIPLFLRKLPRIEVTGTFKHQKVELRDQGINPDKCVSEGNRDALWRYDESSKTYKPFGSKEFVELQTPRAKL